MASVALLLTGCGDPNGPGQGGDQTPAAGVRGPGYRPESWFLLLDEPLTGLGLVSAHPIDRIIHAETGRGHSVVLTRDDLDEARAADHVLLMDGRVVASGPPEQVLTRANLEEVYGKGVPRPHRPIDGPACEPGRMRTTAGFSGRKSTPGTRRRSPPCARRG